MSTRPRNPRYFPRMKVRGARRRQQAWMQRVYRGFDLMGKAAILTAKQMAFLAEAYEGYKPRYVMGMETLALGHQFDSPGPSPVPSVTGTYDEEKPSERRQKP